MKITRENLKNIVREAMIEENEYQEFFKKALEKTGKSIPQMSDEEKKAFFNKIEATWKSKGEKNERFGRGVEGPTFGSDNEEDLDEEAVVVSKRTPEGNIVSKLKEELETVNEGPSFKIKNSISKKEWNKTHKDFKSIIDGVHYVMKLTNQGTALVPVKIEESIEESAGCGCGGSKMNEEFKSKDSTFEKVYGIFDKRDYFNAKGLAKVQIGNFERALQKNDKGAQQILDKFNGDMDKAKEYIIQVITDRKKEEAFNQYKAFKAAVDSIQKGNPIHGAVDLVKSRIHNNSQKYTMALYSTLRNQKFNKWKDVHADVDSLIGESVNEAKYTVIDPRGNSLGTADKTQVFMAAKKKGGEKTGHFVVSAKNALKARRTLEKFKGDFKNPKLKDIMAGLYESVKK